MRPTRGFTLLELMVAAAVTALLAALLLSVTSQVLGAWSRVSGQLTVTSQANIILDQIASDLESALVEVDENVRFAATVQREQTGTGDAEMTGASWPVDSKPRGAISLQLTPASDRLADARFGQAGVWLRFFTTVPDSNDTAANRSAPRAVSYQLLRRRLGEKYLYQLYRSQVRPGGAPSTFEAGYDLFSTLYTTPNGTQQHPGNVRKPNAAFLIGNHVVDFGLWVYARNAGGALTKVFPVANEAGASFLATTRIVATPAGYAGRPVVRGYPAVVDIMIRILDDEGAQHLWNLESGRVLPPAGMTREDYWWTLAETHGRVFTRRVELLAAPH